MLKKIDVTRHIKIVEKIPFVRNLSLHQMQQVLQAGSLETHPVGHLLCKDGEKSTAMYILLAGELAVRDGSTLLANVMPVDIVGEMGVITNQSRCATIEVVRDVTVIKVGKMQFDALLKQDVDMAARIYKNMLDSLSQKLRSNNERLSESKGQDNLLLAASV
ncbi:MAG: cyclic nucleotide-binding domain-containing protein [Candidatus Latescibacteria bacterium]|jgi:CRP-like cAMP-binding protein|nr:cyclic nucleotide-binding domain-containing protein [Candidatus Latescibacterota bacterium]MBT4139532.1 cyclic nucleotide-binding domain-containing protein [Candidatus Latescibacterota bacterium]MBT5833162.1 cyclic nucleotide-binding domain-containing protein [Candidatus Latescibacterota bacterium]